MCIQSISRACRLVTFVSIFFVSFLFAAPYDGDIMKLRQPDGTWVSVKVYGDEFYQRIEDLEGYTLVRDSAGWIQYAMLDSKQHDLVPIGTTYTGDYGPNYQQIIQRLTKHLDVSQERSNYFRNQKKLEWQTPDYRDLGIQKRSIPQKVNAITILLDFPDEPSAFPASEVDSMMNQKGYKNFGNVGSVRDYYLAMSQGKLDLTSSVVGYYRAKKSKLYYDNTAAGRKKELLDEVLNWFSKESKFDFSKVTTDANKDVIAVNILYAGIPALGWAQGLWPHAASVSPKVQVGSSFIGRYQMTNLSFDPCVGTICHENGHMVCGLPDLYDTDHLSKGAGYYCLMSFNDKKIPQFLSAPYLFRLGWINPTDITNEKSGTVCYIAANTPNSFIYKNKSNENEFFMIEARQLTGYGKNMRDAGLYLWHVDKSKTANTQEQMTPDQHFYVSFEQADNKFELEKNINFGNAGDAFTSLTARTFSDSTQPSSKWWNNSNSGLCISSISAPGDSMSFVVGTAPLSVIAPCVKDTLYSGQKTIITWNKTGIQGTKVKIELSTGKDQPFTTLADQADNVGSFEWQVAFVQSNFCRIKISEVTTNTHSISDIFTIVHKASIQLPKTALTIKVTKGKTVTEDIVIQNTGKGKLTYSLETQNQTRTVFVNELYPSDIYFKYPQNGFEILNSGDDIDMTGWCIKSTDNVGSNIDFYFPNGFIFKAQRSIIFSRLQLAPSDSTFLHLVDWHRTSVTKKSLNLSVAIYNRMGTCVDFVKTVGNETPVPPGFEWQGQGVSIDQPKRWPTMYRNTLTGKGNANLWKQDTVPTPHALNKGQTFPEKKAYWFKLSAVKGSVDSVASSKVIATVTTTNLEIGTYHDTLFIAHNCKDVPNPIVLPVTVIVDGTVNIKIPTDPKKNVVLVGPNPVQQGSVVTFTYNKSLVRKTTLTVFDPVGTIMYLKTAKFVDKWDLTDLKDIPVKPGVYKILIECVMDDLSSHSFSTMVGVKQ